MGASDLHVLSGYPPVLRIQGDIQPVDFQVISHDQCRQLVYEIMSDEQIAKLEKNGDVDFSYQIPGDLRVRANVFEQNNGISAALRLLPAQIFPLEQLGLPFAIARFTELSRGLVVVTGPPGSGKSATLAALIDHINSNQRKHIISLEDPIEYLHTNKLSIVNQREIGRHAPTFAAGLRAALREDPNIIMVGEMRDNETISLALTAAEIGQLVFGTLHTPSAPQTVNRIVDAFPSSEQDQVRAVLADSLLGVVAQRLIRNKDGRGRAAAVELLFMTPAISAMIREKKTLQITSAMQTGKKIGMQLMEESLAQLVREGKVTPEDAGVAEEPGIGGVKKPTVLPSGMVA
jgi:twitching motility protein PilT